MPSIQNRTSGTLLPKSRRFVEIKREWSGNWLFVRYLTPLMAKDAVAPEVPVAQFQFDLGQIKRENSFAYAQYSPVSLRDYFIRIITQREGSGPVVVWTGVVSDEEVIYDRSEFPSGQQIVTTYGLQHLIDPRQIDTAKVWEQSEVWDIAWVPTFNDHKRKGKGVKGNRSSVVHTENDNFVFERNGELWNNKQIIEYLIEFFGHDEIEFTLSGQTVPLENIVDVHRLDGLTLWQALNRLIDRRRGL